MLIARMKAVLLKGGLCCVFWFGLFASSAFAAQKAMAPAPAATLSLMAQKNMPLSSPILMRIFKKESVLEVWKQTREGRFALLKSFPICRWSGQLGPKRRQGDRQSPEGFYAITARQMNPYSAYHLSFDTGYPNAYDRAQGATGSALMVHGICSSAGCYAMTNRQISEIFALARDALELAEEVEPGLFAGVAPLLKDEVGCQFVEDLRRADVFRVDEVEVGSLTDDARLLSLGGAHEIGREFEDRVVVECRG
jgi:murein L,D-transpeptidase YafK